MPALVHRTDLLNPHTLPVSMHCMVVNGL